MSPGLHSHIHSATKCTLPVKSGNGYSQLPRFYYNAKTRACEQFVYSGKGGNQVSFLHTFFYTLFIQLYSAKAAIRSWQR